MQTRERNAASQLPTRVMWMRRKVLGAGEILGEACTARQIDHARSLRPEAKAIAASNTKPSTTTRLASGNAFIRERGRTARFAAVGGTSIAAATSRSHCPLQPRAAMTHNVPACYHRRNALVGHRYAYILRSSESADARVISKLKEQARRGHEGNAAASAGDSSRSRWLLHDGDAR